VADAVPRDSAIERRAYIAGLGYGVTVHVVWGLAPLYWKLLREISAPEVVAHRVVWSLLTFGALIAVSARFGQMGRAIRDRAVLRAMLASGVLIACNWLAFIYAVETDRVLHASLGYFINPLVAVLLGRVFLGERLRGIELVALALAAAGVVQYAVIAGTLPWISLVVAFSFGTYSLVRKTAPVDALIGSTLETALLFPVSAGYLCYLLASGGGALGRVDVGTHALIVISGPVTAIPTLWFINAARRLPLWTMGFLQYLTPTGQFLLAVLVWHEPFSTLHLSSFACIWAGLLLFSVGMWRRLRAR
jgi:chloramphenicol-sensitive protein RarD